MVIAPRMSWVRARNPSAVNDATGSFEMATAHSSNPQPVIPGPFPWAQIKMAVSSAVGEPCRRGYLISTQPCGEP